MDLSSDQEADDAEAEFVEVDPSGRYGRMEAKQEEARKKKEEVDAIETQRKKDKEELELERSKKMEGGVDKKSSNGAGPSTRRESPRADHPDDERVAGNTNRVNARNRKILY